ncbi:MAG: hypothetical protein H6620_09345 [Halobacteriovoraceae bacterium]|nr:hypothetical protein [Halobacteriovoraceae bacterium]
MNQEDMTNAIAVVGMSGRFPGADSIQDFWKNICEKKETISSFADEQLIQEGILETQVLSPNYVKSRGTLNGIELFDEEFFGFSPKEAQITDPQHRLFLECAWEALENAGYSPDKYSGSIGVYGGCGINSYYLNNIYPNKQIRDTVGDFILRIGNDKDFLTTKVSYKLNLNGPSIAVQTACSTSLVSVSIACDHLLTYQCDMALAGGVSVFVPQVSGYIYQEGMIFSKGGKCSPFDASAEGTVMSNGLGIVVLKRLEDAIGDRDHILSVIKGYGVNNDGFEKISYSAPSVNGQEKAISSAISMAGVDPETIGYVEAHGTGTILGDPVEIQGLTNAFQSKRFQYCALGSVKSNIGHTFEAAGVIGLIKASLALYHRKIPPSLNFSKPNPHIAFEKTPFYINTDLKDWDMQEHPRRACVSSFGIGGTNAHMILEEWSQKASSEVSKPPYQLLLSARTPSALKKMAINLGSYLKKYPEVSLADTAYTLWIGRKSFDCKRLLTCRNREEAISLLLNFDLNQHHFPPKFSYEHFWDDKTYCRVPLPTYPFEKKRYWIDPPCSQEEAVFVETKSPQNIENFVKEVWEEFLGVESIGIHDDFFQIGGDSLSAVEIVARLSKCFDVKLGTQALLAHPTIAQLSKIISEQQASISPLIKLREGIEGSPLFLVHPIEGNLFCYRELISELKCENPLYGIQSIEKEMKSIEELGSFYLEEMRKIQNRGPYYLVGASFGGIIAYEIARQLDKVGDSVALLCLLDATNPDPFFGSLHSDEERLACLVELLENKPVSPKDITQEKVIQSLGLGGLNSKDQQAIFDKIRMHLKMLYNYKPKPYRGKIQFFQSVEIPDQSKKNFSGQSWVQLVNGNIEIHEIYGNHLSILKRSQIQALINFLEEILQKATVCQKNRLQELGH